MPRQEAWADLTGAIHICCARYPSAEMHQLLLPGWASVSSLGLSLPKAAGSGSLEPKRHWPLSPGPPLSSSCNSLHSAF